MAQTTTRIMAGPCRIFHGVTAGASGTPPTYITHTAGVPATGTEVGHTLGDASFKYQAVKEDIDSEQSLASVDVWTKEEKASIDCDVQEQTYLTLQKAFDAVGAETIGAGDAFWFGGGTTILLPGTFTIMLTAIQRNAPTKFTIAVLYKVYSVSGIDVSFGKAKRSTYKLLFQGLADTSRTAGDQIGYYRFER